jgi:hypothetical protein
MVTSVWLHDSLPPGECVAPTTHPGHLFKFWSHQVQLKSRCSGLGWHPGGRKEAAGMI